MLKHLSFTPKETDIYKIHQSGDLANLDGLDDSALARLPSMLKLRNAMYSSEFRQYLSKITDAGPLSGKKTDMAINVYTPGCHLLCHDDVIGSRRVSYILYMTDPDDAWRPWWGGSLRLYPTRPVKGSGRGQQALRAPIPDHSFAIIPEWNMLSFFAVQPGESFHDVEEVYAEGDEKEHRRRMRVAISGWYHIPQEGEDGYVAGLEEQLAATSSLTQLQGASDKYDLPQPRPQLYPDEEIKETANETTDETAVEKMESKDEAATDQPEQQSQESSYTDILSEADCSFLLRYISPTYLIPDTMADLNSLFEDSSLLRIDNFLRPRYAKSLREFIDSQAQILSNITNTVEDGNPWTVARPPHKHRYLYMLPSTPDPTTQNLLTVVPKQMNPLKEILQTLIPSSAFRKWLSLATGLKVTTHDCRARRFRRGNDYTLATGYEEEEPRLELSLGITPTKGWGNDEDEDAEDKDEGEEEEKEEGKEGEKEKEEGKEEGKEGKEGGKKEEKEGKTTTNGETRETAKAKEKNKVEKSTDTGTEKKPKKQKDAKSKHPTDNPGGYEIYMAADSSSPNSKPAASDPAIYQSAADDDDEEDDSILFSMDAGWNRLSLVLRDKGVMRFVKYVSAAAPGDRWDVVGEFGVEMGEEEEADGDGEEGEGGEGEGDEESESEDEPFLGFQCSETESD